jgi:lysophospholipase L1-like esterase
MSTRICIFGDSITWGAVDPQNGGWVALLRRFFESNNDYNVEIYNQGVSGDNTNDLLVRFHVECDAREPQIIIFAIGVNDTQYNKTRDTPRVTLEKFHNNIVELINQAIKFTDKIVFIGLIGVDEFKMMPTPWEKEQFYDNYSIEKYNSIIKKISTEQGLQFIDMLGLLGNKDLDDGLHPNSNGHKKMFLRIKEFLLTSKIIK